MAFVLVQHKNSGAVQSGANPTCVFTNPVTSGNNVRGSITWGSASAADFSSITDDKGNTYSISDKILGPTNTQSLAFFHAENITNGPKTLTATMLVGGQSFILIEIEEWSGEDTSGTAMNAHGGQRQATPGTGTDAITSGNITTNVNGCNVVGCTMDNLASVVIGTGETLSDDNTANNPGTLAEHKIQAALGNVASTFTDTGGPTESCTVAAAFKPPTAAGGDGVRLMSRVARGPTMGPALRRMMPQAFPTPGLVDLATPASQIQPLRSPGPGMGPRLRRMIPQRFPDPFGLSTLFPTEGNITLAGVAASLTLILAAVAGAITIGGNVPSLSNILVPTPAPLVISGNAPTITLALAPSSGSVVLSGNASALALQLQAVEAPVVISGNAPSLPGGSTTIAPTEGFITLDGGIPSISGATPDVGLGGSSAVHPRRIVYEKPDKRKPRDFIDKIGEPLEVDVPTPPELTPARPLQVDTAAVRLAMGARVPVAQPLPPLAPLRPAPPEDDDEDDLLLLS